MKWQFSLHFLYFSSWHSHPPIYLKPDKGPPFRQSLPRRIGYYREYPQVLSASGLSDSDPLRAFWLLTVPFVPFMMNEPVRQGHAFYPRPLDSFSCCNMVPIRQTVLTRLQTWLGGQKTVNYIFYKGGLVRSNQEKIYEFRCLILDLSVLYQG